jgi:DNA-binding CsgD family transcriptional regulator/PAS domain-containing protein
MPKDKRAPLGRRDAGSVGGTHDALGPSTVTITGCGRILDLSRTARRALLASASDVEGRSLADVLDQAARRAGRQPPRWMALVADPSKLLDRPLELSASTVDGRPFTADVSVVRDGAEPDRFVVELRERCGQAVEDDELVRRVAMLEQGEEIWGIGSWDWNWRTGELRWSANLFRLFGLEPYSITPTTEWVFDHIYPPDREGVRRAVEAAAEAGSSRTLRTLHYRLVRPDGELRHVTSQLGTLDEEGVPTRFVGTVRDVTLRRQFAREIAGHIAVDEVLAGWASLADGAETLLRKLGEAMELDVGVFWLARGGELVAHSFWSCDEVDFTDGMRPLSLLADRFLPVKAWSSRQPVVVSSVSANRRFPRSHAAVRAGLNGGLALPALGNDKPYFVLEFYGREDLKLTETFLRSLTGIGHELGHFFGRRSGELQPDALTVRQREILQLASQGLSAKEIADRLTVSPSTVKTHFDNIYEKWELSDRTAAVARALRLGLID